jgi:hypothetical protein
MTSMDQIHRIRDLYYGQDKSLTEIASMEKLDWRTVRKYVDMEDFNEAPPSPDGEESVGQCRETCFMRRSSHIIPIWYIKNNLTVI